MDEKFYGIDENFYAVINNEDGTFNIGEFTNSSADSCWIYDLRLQDVDTAKNVCEVLVEVFKDGWNECNY